MQDEHFSEPSFYAIIPATVRYDKRLVANAKLLYGEITCMTHKFGFCYAKNEYFAELYGVSTKTVSEWVQQLVQCGYLKTFNKQTERGGKRMIYLPETNLTEIKQKLDSALHKNRETGLPKNVMSYYNIIKGIIIQEEDGIYDTIDDSEESSNGTAVISFLGEVLQDKIFPEKNVPKAKVLKETIVPEALKKYIPLLDHWNSKPFLRKHKPSTKTYTKALERFRDICEGRFRRYNIDARYLVQNNLEIGCQRQNFDVAGVLLAIDRFNLMCDPERPDFNKARFPKDCAGFVYNDMKKTSFFLTLYGENREPKSAREAVLDEKALKLYKTEFRLNKMNEVEEAELIRCVNFVARQKRIFDNGIGKYQTPSQIRDAGWYRTHLSFLRERYFDTGFFTISHIGNTTCWKKYVDWIKQRHGVKHEIAPNPRQIESARLRHEQKNIIPDIGMSSYTLAAVGA
jgi:hypothetical protein